MSIARTVLEIANEYASSLNAGIPAIQRELADIEKQKSGKEAKLNVARNALKRVSEFPALLRSEVVCPYCWINDGRKATLRTVGHGPGDDPRSDMFRCNSCHRSFEV